MVKVTLEQATKAQRGISGQRHASAALPPSRRRGIHCTECWVGPRAGVDGCGKSRPPSGFDTRTVQPLRVATD